MSLSWACVAVSMLIKWKGNSCYVEIFSYFCNSFYTMKEMDTSSHNTEKQAQTIVSEPISVYGTATGGESFSAMSNTTLSKSGRMTVDEYFNELWAMYLKESEKLQS